MRVLVYDAEVFKHDWIMGFKNVETGEYTQIHNDNESVAEFIANNDIYVGFNSKHYDQFIMKAICADFTPEQIKHLNDYLISGEQGWEYPPLRDYYFSFNNVDIMDDMQMGLSLKAIEAHLGLNIEETEVDFAIDRPLTDKEIELTCKYNRADLDATERILKLRKSYLENKTYISSLTNLSPLKALSMTNAKLTAAMLNATAKTHTDERDYVYPSNLKREYIPKEVFEFFDRMEDKSIPDDELFKGKLQFFIGECPVTMGFGGIHSAIPNYMWKEGD